MSAAAATAARNEAEPGRPLTPFHERLLSEELTLRSSDSHQRMANALSEAKVDLKLKQLAGLKGDITGLLGQADAKKEAELLLTEAGEWIEGRIKAAGEAAAALVLAEIHQEAQAAQKARRAMVRAALTMVVLALVVLSGLGGVVLAGLR